jgi:hypothetical protein
MTRPDFHDDLLDRAFRESLGGRVASALDAAASSAWSASASRKCLIAASAKWCATAPPVRIRMLALCGAVAVVVHLAMSLLGPREPLVAVLPFVVLASCLLTAAFAGPLAKTLERIHR